MVDYSSGVGFQRATTSMTNFTELLVWHLACIAASARTPWQHCLSWAWTIGKRNGKQGCKGLRIVHGMRTLPKLLLNTVFDVVWKKIDPIIPQNVYHVSRRRREEAVAVHTIAGNRLNMNNITWLRSLRDTANAYPRVHHSCVLDAIAEAPNPEHDIMVQSVESNIFAIEAQNQFSYLRGGLRRICRIIRRHIALLLGRVASTTSMAPTTMQAWSLRTPLAQGPYHRRR